MPAIYTINDKFRFPLHGCQWTRNLLTDFNWTRCGLSHTSATDRSYRWHSNEHTFWTEYSTNCCIKTCLRVPKFNSISTVLRYSYDFHCNQSHWSVEHENISSRTFCCWTWKCGIKKRDRSKFRNVHVNCCDGRYRRHKYWNGFYSVSNHGPTQINKVYRIVGFSIFYVTPHWNLLWAWNRAIPRAVVSIWSARLARKHLTRIWYKGIYWFLIYDIDKSVSSNLQIKRLNLKAKTRKNHQRVAVKKGKITETKTTPMTRYICSLQICIDCKMIIHNP